MEKFFIFICLLWVVKVNAFTLLSTDTAQKGWSSKNITFHLNPANCPTDIDLVSAIDTALNAWNGVPTSGLTISRGDDTSATTYQDPPVIVCDPNFGDSDIYRDDSDPSGVADYVPAVGGAQFSSHSVSAGLLILNVKAGAQASVSNIYRRLGPKLLEIIMAHEIGHVIGLGHSQESSALMYYDASKKTDLGLHQDDMDGISYLYPRDELGPDKFMGCGRINSGSSGNSARQLLIYVLLFMLPLGVIASMRDFKGIFQRPEK